MPQLTEHAGTLDDIAKEVTIKEITEVGNANVLYKMPEDAISEPVHPSTAIPLHRLPEDLQICLETVGNDLLDNHTQFSKALKMRWERYHTPAQPIEDILIKYVCYLSPFVCHRLTMSVSSIS